MTREAATRTGRMAVRSQKPSGYTKSMKNESRYQDLVHGGAAPDRGQPTRSGGPREHVLNGDQFRSASQARIK